MQLDQLERTIELLRQKLSADSTAFHEMTKHEHLTDHLKPLDIKIMGTVKKIESLNKEYQRRLNKGIEHFDRFRPNRAIHNNVVL